MWLRKSLQVCGYQFQNRFLTMKTLCTYALLIVFIIFHLRPLADFCMTVGYPVTPWIFPFMNSSYMFQIFLIAGAVLLMADAPFYDENRLYLLHRTGSVCWYLGAVLYIVFVAVIYVFSVCGIALFTLSDVLYYDTGWGKVLGTMMQSSASAEYSIPMDFSYTLFQYEPGEAMVYSLFLEICCIIWIGLVICIGNEILKRHMGVVIAFGYLFLDVTIYNVMSRDVFRMSPLSLSQLSYFDGDMARAGVTLAYAVRFFLVSFLVFMAVILIVGNRRRIGARLPGKKGGKDGTND